MSVCKICSLCGGTYDSWDGGCDCLSEANEGGTHELANAADPGRRDACFYPLETGKRITNEAEALQAARTIGA